MSISTKFGHSMSKGSRDTRGGPRRPPPVSGKDFLMPCGIGLRESCGTLAIKNGDIVLVMCLIKIYMKMSIFLENRKWLKCG